ncbi:hypothetical protein MishRS11D_09850 [Methylomagnum ishizawai]|nr:hypothetical protein MishRS11D_09850 [Methylomagnum ishizawai]
MLPLTIPRRRLTIAIDGVDGSGKSSLARFLSWQLDMPAIEADMYLMGNGLMPRYDFLKLRELIHEWHQLNQPVIVESLFVLQLLRDINVKPDCLIRVNRVGHTGSNRWQKSYANYLAEFPRANVPDHTLTWRQQITPT